jgi:hypothetical protein
MLLKGAFPMASDKTSQFKFQQNFSYALHYLKLGWSVIPIQQRTKIPLVKWKEFQRMLPTESEIKQWWQRWPDAGVGTVTGKVSNLVALDFDSEQALLKFEKEVCKLSGTIRSKTKRGFHCFFSLPNELVLPKQDQLFNEVDFKGELAMITLPPSIHKSGSKYE